MGDKIGGLRMTTAVLSRGHAATDLGNDAVRVSLLGSFEVRCGSELIELTFSGRRLVAFLALLARQLQRTYVAGSLWPDVSDERAAGNLRSTVWRLRQHFVQLVDATSTHLRLADGVRVDLHHMWREAILFDSGGCVDRLLLDEAALFDDVLPDWYEDWVVFERERYRQLRLHALETLCERLTAARRHAEAVQAGLAAIAGEPRRESAHRALIKAHLAEGNPGEAIRQYRIYRRLLAREFDLQPSALMEELLAGLRCTAPPAGRR